MKKILLVLGILSLTSVTSGSLFGCAKPSFSDTVHLHVRPNIAKMNNFEVYVGATDQQIRKRANAELNTFLKTSSKNYEFKILGDSRLDSQGIGSITILSVEPNQDFVGTKKIDVTKRKLINLIHPHILGDEIYQDDAKAKENLLSKFKKFTKTEIENGRLRADVSKLEDLVDIEQIKESNSFLGKKITSNDTFVKKEIQVKIKNKLQSPYEVEEKVIYYFNSQKV